MNPSKILAAAFVVGIEWGASAASAAEPAQLQYDLDAAGRRIHGASRKLDWNMIQLADGSFAVDLLVPIEALRSNDAAFDAALARAVESQGRSFLEVQGVVRQGRFEGTLRIAG